MKIPELLNKIGITRVAMILIAGIALILLSSLGGGNENKNNLGVPEENNTVNTTTTNTEEDTIRGLERRLKDVLSKVDGVGKVDVMITLKSSKELIINKDREAQSQTSFEKDAQGGERTTTNQSQSETTIAVNGDEPYVLKEMEPTINGIIIVAEGGDSITIKNELTTAAQALFDVPAHKIKVMKMLKK